MLYSLRDHALTRKIPIAHAATTSTEEHRLAFNIVYTHLQMRRRGQILCLGCYRVWLEGIRILQVQRRTSGCEGTGTLWLLAQDVREVHHETLRRSTGRVGVIVAIGIACHIWLMTLRAVLLIGDLGGSLVSIVQRNNLLWLVVQLLGLRRLNYSSVVALIIGQIRVIVLGRPILRDRCLALASCCVDFLHL